MASKINYNNKAPFQTLEEIPDENKVNASDMNEIKQVVNTNADELNTAKEDIENLESGQGTSSTDIANLKRRVTTLETDNTTNKNNINNLQNNKVDKVDGKGLSTEDFTTELKSKLENLENYDDTEIKEDISNLEAGQTEQDKQIDILLNALPAETQEAENINIKGTIPVKFKEFKVSGNSKQETSDTMPSPEFPSEIQNVEGNVNVTVCNKNLLPYPYKTITEIDIVTDLGDGRLLLNGTLASNIAKEIQEFYLKAGSYKLLFNTEKVPNGSYLLIQSMKTQEYIKQGITINTNFELQEDTNIKISFVLVAGTYNNYEMNLMVININSYNEDYVSHQGQTVTFPLAEGQKLMKGDYLADDGIHHKRKQIELDGTDFSLYSNQVAGRTIYTISAFSNNNNFKTYDSSILCNILKQGASSNGNNYLNNNGSSGNLYVSIENSILGITDESTNEEKLQAFQNLIAETGFVYEGELAEEEIEPYTEEQQEAYNQLKQLTAYEEETNIYSTNEVGPVFTVTAVKDINSVITQLNTVLLERS